ncbi:MAG: hypothetical protein ACJAQ7_001654 [Sediminicola sp.]|jgi:hypothetical protein
MAIIWHTTIYWTYSGALWFFVEAHAFRALIRRDIIYFITYWLLNFIGVHF